MTVEDLAIVLAARKTAIKSALLDQQVAAGVGNWIADELLFQAGIHPEKIANQLSRQEVEALHAAIQDVLRTAIAKEARYADFPPSYIIHARAWDTSPYEDAGQHRRCPRCHTPISQSKVGGRTTYFCEQCQPVSS